MTSYFVSAELSSFLGIQANQCVSRQEIEHKVLFYAKENHLMNEQNPMVIRTNNELETLMNGKRVFAGFSIIPYLKHHLIAYNDQDTATESSQGDQMNETPDDSNNEEETNEEEESNEEEEIRRVILRHPNGQELIFETSNDEHVRIQRTFLMSTEEFRELTNVILAEPPTIVEKQEQPYEYLAFMVMFLTTLLTFSLWLSIVNQGLEKI